MIGYHAAIECSVYDSDRLKKRIDEIRILERDLNLKHSYGKYKVHADYLEVLELEQMLSVTEYDTLVRPYMMQREGDLRWEFRMRFSHTDRFYWLLKPEVREAKHLKLKQLLKEDSAYERMPFGAQLLYFFQRSETIRELADKTVPKTKEEIEDTFESLEKIRMSFIDQSQDDFDTIIKLSFILNHANDADEKKKILETMIETI